MIRFNVFFKTAGTGSIRLPFLNSSRRKKLASHPTESSIVALKFRRVQRQVERVSRDLGDLKQLPALEFEYIPKCIWKYRCGDHCVDVNVVGVAVNDEDGGLHSIPPQKIQRIPRDADGV